MKTRIAKIHPEIKDIESEAVQIPAQINLFTGEEEPVRRQVEREFDEDEIDLREGLTLVKSGDTSQLIVSGFGAFLSKVSERLTVKLGKKVIYEFPFLRLSEVTVASRGVTISTDLLQELCQRGIQINFLQVLGKPYAKIMGWRGYSLAAFLEPSRKTDERNCTSSLKRHWAKSKGEFLCNLCVRKTSRA
jgi:hypothetical protein